ncbi:hypothetical protein D917_10616 [Trichinella nativa]|uniref:Uncharacterized protein n=1 Tax=Trichinella nativa TaxID=6335 RepID=A0A1Y3E9V4_9BILA|nr:hypothetical protein D917_10616 [Trichinella nativa]
MHNSIANGLVLKEQLSLQRLKSEMIANKQTETSFVIRQHVDCSKVAVENNRRKHQLTGWFLAVVKVAFN